MLALECCRAPSKPDPSKRQVGVRRRQYPEVESIRSGSPRVFVQETALWHARMLGEYEGLPSQLDRRRYRGSRSIDQYVRTDEYSLTTVVLAERAIAPRAHEPERQCGEVRGDISPLACPSVIRRERDISTVTRRKAPNLGTAAHGSANTSSGCRVHPGKPHQGATHATPKIGKNLRRSRRRNRPAGTGTETTHPCRRSTPRWHRSRVPRRVGRRTTSRDPPALREFAGRVPVWP